MGTIWYLVNDDRQTFYELGKGFYGGYYELLDPAQRRDELVKSDVDAVQLTIYTDIFEGLELPPETEENKEDWEYAQQIAEDLVAMCQGSDPKKLRLVADSGQPHSPPKGYKCVGSRYYRDDPEENAEAVRHAQSLVDTYGEPWPKD